MVATRLLPALFLLVATPFLAEVPTGSAPVTVFFHPVVFLLFATIGYGFPVLIIRELQLRFALGLPSVFILGFAYGLFNEGLYAQTTFHPFHAPITQLATYGLVGNVRIPFLLLICGFHGLFSVIAPILISHWLFPAAATRRWVPAWLLWAMGLLSAAAAIHRFFSFVRPSEFPEIPGAFPGSVGHFLFMCAVWAGCAALAWALRGLRSAIPWMAPAGTLALLGAALFILVVLAPTFLGDFAVPLPFFYAFFAMLLAGILWLLARIDAAPLARQMPLVWGGEMALAVFGILLGLFVVGNPINAAAVAVLLAVFAVLQRRSVRAQRPALA